MIEISKNGVIQMYRGDTFEFPLFINMGTKINPAQYVLQDDDMVYVSIGEPNQPFEHALIRKTFTVADLDDNGDVIVRLAPSDTENVVPGVYFMQAKIKLTNGNIGTITPVRKFIIYK